MVSNNELFGEVNTANARTGYISGAMALDSTVAKAANQLTDATWTDTRAGYVDRVEPIANSKVFYIEATRTEVGNTGSSYTVPTGSSVVVTSAWCWGETLSDAGQVTVNGVVVMDKKENIKHGCKCVSYNPGIKAAAGEAIAVWVSGGEAGVSVDAGATGYYIY